MTGMKSYVYLNTFSGLGNQLFMLGAALSFAFRTGRLLKVRKHPRSISTFGTRDTYWSGPLFPSVREFCLMEPDEFDKEVERKQKQGPSSFFEYHDVCPDYAEKQVPISVPPNAKGDIYLRGYYMSLKHTQLDWNWLMPMLVPSFLLREVQGATSFQPNVAFLHLRRGDTLKIQHHMLVMTMPYYNKAVKRFPHKTHFVVVVEKEEHEIVAKELSLLECFSSSSSYSWEIFRKESDRGLALDVFEMLAMSLCPRGGILANSTFSTWSSLIRLGHPFFSGSKIKTQPTFVVPSRWLRGNKKLDIVPSPTQVVEVGEDVYERTK